MMYECRKSYSSIVPEKPPNKASRKVAAEAGEERELAKGNPPMCNMPRTQSRTRMHKAREWVGQEIKADNNPCLRILALSPKAGTGCGNSARPGLWRGARATALPTPSIRN
jgi:hypothetical protein